MHLFAVNQMGVMSFVIAALVSSCGVRKTADMNEYCTDHPEASRCIGRPSGIGSSTKGADATLVWTQAIDDFSLVAGQTIAGKQVKAVDLNINQTVIYSFDSAQMTCDEGSWDPQIKISPSSGMLSGTPRHGDVGSCTVRIIASSESGVIAFSLTITVLPAPSAPPTDISLSATSINENVAAGSLVGTFSIAGQNAGDSHTYSLVAGAGVSDNSSFTISGDELRINSSPDFESKSSYGIRVRATDDGGLFIEKEFTIMINDVNESPTDISFSTNSISENVAPGTTVGTLSTTDQDVGDSHSYSLVTGTGSADNDSFAINGNELQIIISPNHEVKSSYTVRIQTTDGVSTPFSKQFLISISDVNEAPTDIGLSAQTIDDGIAPGTVIGTLAAIDEDWEDTFIYSIVSGEGDDDNASFSIDGDKLTIEVSPNYYLQDRYSVRIEVKDSGSLTYERSFTISVNEPVSLDCPAGYIPVPRYTDEDTGTVPAFCVMKYEAKNVGGVATSQPEGTPWARIMRGATPSTSNSAWKACRDLNDPEYSDFEFDLISNAQWQSMARQIETYQSAPGVYVNWSNNSNTGANYLNRGHADNNPSSLQAAGPDDNPCINSNAANCADPTHSHFLQKRTHTLPNGEVIWDLAGNVWEWMRDSSTFNYGSNNPWYSFTADTGNACIFSSGCTGPQGKPKAAFGPLGDYSDKSSSPQGGLGYGHIRHTDGVIVRGGNYDDGGNYTGLFAAKLSHGTTGIYFTIGFRCVAVPVL